MESGIMVNGELVNISVNAVHLGHTISSSDRESISLTAKSSFWKSFNSFISNFGHTYSFIKCSLLKQFCCSFYGSPLWNLNVIAALSDQFPIKVSLERRFIRFIKKCLSSSNSIVNVISQIAICNPMSTAGKNYRSVLDANGDYNNNQTVTSWQYTCEIIKESIRTLRELIDVRDGYSECIGFTSDEIDEFILALCTG